MGSLKQAKPAKKLLALPAVAGGEAGHTAQEQEEVVAVTEEELPLHRMSRREARKRAEGVLQEYEVGRPACHDRSPLLVTAHPSVPSSPASWLILGHSNAVVGVGL